MKAITKRLRVLRASAPLSQRDLALKAGLPFGRYWEIENGYRAPTDDEITALARALKVTPTEITDQSSAVAS